MDEREEKLQLEKIELIQRMVVLLEEVAFLLSRGVFEKDKYLENLYASRFNQTASVHGDLRTQPAARTGEVPEHEPRGAAQVCCNPRKRAAAKEKDDKLTGGKKYYDGSI